MSVKDKENKHSETDRHKWVRKYASIYEVLVEKSRENHTGDGPGEADAEEDEEEEDLLLASNSARDLFL